MKRLLLPLFVTSSVFAAAPPVPKFSAITLDRGVQIGYGLAIADVDGDKAPDVLLADKKQFCWYRNPGAGKAGDAAAWTKHLLAENLTEKDNVCIAAQDIDGDGKAEIAVGAEWNPSDTEKSGAVFYLQAPADRTQPWTAIKFPEVEPTTHRMRWMKVGPSTGGSGEAPSAGKETQRWALLVVPLHGRGNKNGEGVPVKVLLYHPPADPRTPWRAEVVSDHLHMTHNFTRLSIADSASADGVLLGGKEGIMSFRRSAAKWEKISPTITGDQPAGVGEIRVGTLAAGTQFIATVEPMHGNSLVVYTPQASSGKATPLTRRVLTDKLVDGHAIACGNLLGGLANLTASDQIVAGWRGKPGAPGSTIGVSVWAAGDTKGEQWRETVIDPDGMACEDLLLADLDGNGQLDIVASGRATKNLKVYFNQTTPAK